MCASAKNVADKGDEITQNVQPTQNQSGIPVEVEKSCVELGRPANAMVSAPWWSRVIFYWPYPLLKLGMERPLVDTDVPEILPVDTSRYNREYLSKLWEREKERCSRKNNPQIGGTTADIDAEASQSNYERPSLHKAILKDYFRSIWFIQPVMGIGGTAKIVQALFLGNLIESFENDAENGYKHAAVIVCCGIIILFEHRKCVCVHALATASQTKNF